MRPVQKGSSPYTTITDYKQARPYLKDRIGLYCSYCGFEISHAGQVEHVSSKHWGGSLTGWDNLLLGCQHCNSRKKDYVINTNVNDYLWPDKYNTALAYTYEHGFPHINKQALELIDQNDPSQNALQKATALYNVVGLGNIPTRKTDDNRFWKRTEVYACAKRALDRWKTNPCTALLDTTIDLALAQGFFSVWMYVFNDEPIVLNKLIDAFPGTNRTYYDADGHPKPIIK